MHWKESNAESVIRQQVSCSRNVISSFIPEVRKAQRRSVRKAVGKRENARNIHSVDDHEDVLVTILCRSPPFRATPEADASVSGLIDQRRSDTPGIKFDLAERAMIISKRLAAGSPLVPSPAAD